MHLCLYVYMRRFGLNYFSMSKSRPISFKCVTVIAHYITPVRFFNFFTCKRALFFEGVTLDFRRCFRRCLFIVFEGLCRLLGLLWPNWFSHICMFYSILNLPRVSPSTLPLRVMIYFLHSWYIYKFYMD